MARADHWLAAPDSDRTFSALHPIVLPDTTPAVNPLGVDLTYWSWAGRPGVPAPVAGLVGGTRERLSRLFNLLRLDPAEAELLPSAIVHTARYQKEDQAGQQRAFARVRLYGTDDALHVQGDVPRVTEETLRLLDALGATGRGRLSRFTHLQDLPASDLGRMARAPIAGLDPTRGLYNALGRAEADEIIGFPWPDGLTLGELHDAARLYRLGQMRKVSVVLGGCLFDDASVALEDENGNEWSLLQDGTTENLDRRIARITFKVAPEELTFYEEETPARLGRLSILLVRALLRLNPELRVDIVCDVPEGTYLTYLYDALLNGRLDREQWIAYADRIGPRHQLVTRLFRSRLAVLLDAEWDRVRLRFAGEFGGYADHLLREVRAGNTPRHENAVAAWRAAAVAAGDDVTRMVLDVAPPPNPRRAAALAYVLVLVKAALSADAVFNVDNRNEVMLHGEAVKLLKKLGRLPEFEELGLRAGWIVAIYYLEKLFLEGARPALDPLYRYPIGRLFTRADGTPLGRHDLFRLLYPVPSALPEAASHPAVIPWCRPFR